MAAAVTCAPRPPPPTIVGERIGVRSQDHRPAEEEGRSCSAVWHFVFQIYMDLRLFARAAIWL